MLERKASSSSSRKVSSPTTSYPGGGSKSVSAGAEGQGPASADAPTSAGWPAPATSSAPLSCARSASRARHDACRSGSEAEVAGGGGVVPPLAPGALPIAGRSAAPAAAAPLPSPLEQRAGDEPAGGAVRKCGSARAAALCASLSSNAKWSVWGCAVSAE
eukprot:scaffold7713_cov100-Isochrysis_galbana.AAC.5